MSSLAYIFQRMVSKWSQWLFTVISETIFWGHAGCVSGYHSRLFAGLLVCHWKFISSSPSKGTHLL